MPSSPEKDNVKQGVSPLFVLGLAVTTAYTIGMVTSAGENARNQGNDYWVAAGRSMFLGAGIISIPFVIRKAVRGIKAVLPERENPIEIQVTEFNRKMQSERTRKS